MTGSVYVFISAVQWRTRTPRLYLNCWSIPPILHHNRNCLLGRVQINLPVSCHLATSQAARTFWLRLFTTASGPRQGRPVGDCCDDCGTKCNAICFPAWLECSVRFPETAACRSSTGPIRMFLASSAVQNNMRIFGLIFFLFPFWWLNSC